MSFSAQNGQSYASYKASHGKNWKRKQHTGAQKAATKSHFAASHSRPKDKRGTLGPKGERILHRFTSLYTLLSIALTEAQELSAFVQRIPGKNNGEREQWRESVGETNCLLGYFYSPTGGEYLARYWRSANSPAAPVTGIALTIARGGFVVEYVVALADKEEIDYLWKLGKLGILLSGEVGAMGAIAQSEEDKYSRLIERLKVDARLAREVAKDKEFAKANPSPSLQSQDSAEQWRETLRAQRYAEYLASLPPSPVIVPQPQFRQDVQREKVVAPSPLNIAMKRLGYTLPTVKAELAAAPIERSCQTVITTDTSDKWTEKAQALKHTASQRIATRSSVEYAIEQSASVRSTSRFPR